MARGSAVETSCSTGAASRPTADSTPGRRGTRMRPSPELVGKRAGMQGAGAAERQQREPARVVALSDRHEADALGHLGVDDAMDAERGLLDGEAERARRPRARSPRDELGPQLEAAAGEVLGVEVAQNDGGVGHRRLGSAEAVAGRTRLGARRMRTDPQPLGGVEPGDRAAAGADRIHVDHAARTG